MSSYKFRVLIDTDKEEDIFRDIQISSSADFEVFYQTIINAFDFAGDQLASFYVSNDNWDKGHEIALMDMGMGNNLDSPFLMKETPIGTISSKQGDKLILVYDFLRMWCFLVELIEISEIRTDQPEVTLSIGIAPDENSKEMDFDATMGMGPDPDLGNDIDDIFSDFGDDDGDFDSFENIDDLDI